MGEENFLFSLAFLVLLRIIVRSLVALVSRQRAIIIAILLVLCAGCAKSPQPSSPSDRVAQGRRVYLINCASCHNPDPNLDGSVGPPIAGASRALIEARVLHGLTRLPIILAGQPI